MAFEWFSIPGYEGFYEINLLGQVRSIERKVEHMGRLITAKPAFKNTRVNNSGYMEVRLNKNGITKTLFLHRLLAALFIPNPYQLPEVNHKDGNKLNNCISNLEWCSHQDNIKHAYNTGLIDKNPQPVLDVFLNRIFKNEKELSSFYRVPFKAIKATLKRKDNVIPWMYLKAS